MAFKCSYFNMETDNAPLGILRFLLQICCVLFVVASCKVENNQTNPPTTVFCSRAHSCEPISFWSKTLGTSEFI